MPFLTLPGAYASVEVSLQEVQRYPMICAGRKAMAWSLSERKNVRQAAAGQVAVEKM